MRLIRSEHFFAPHTFEPSLSIASESNTLLSSAFCIDFVGFFSCLLFSLWPQFGQLTQTLAV